MSIVRIILSSITLGRLLMGSLILWLIMCELANGEFRGTYCDPDLLSVVSECSQIVVMETPAYSTQNLLTLCTTRVHYQSGQIKQYGVPFAVEASRDISNNNLRNQLVQEIVNMMDLSEGQKVNLNNISNELELRVVDGLKPDPHLPDNVDHPFLMPTVDFALARWEGQPFYGPPHLKLILEWRPNYQVNDISELTREEKSYHKTINKLSAKQGVSKILALKDCMNLYFREEKMIGEAWVCPHCHRRQQGLKQLALWTVPDLFILHLKRFRQQAVNQRVKVTNFVDFPLTGLDISPYVAKRTDCNLNNSTAYWSPWKRRKTECFNSSRSEDNSYELFAVCNHQGDMQGGHYTAFCRNPVDGHWYQYDDTSVKPVKETQVVTEDAYILFYQRAEFASSSCASSSTSGYSSASNGPLPNSDHWAFRMPPFDYIGPKCSKSQDILNSLDYNTKTETKNEEIVNKVPQSSPPSKMKSSLPDLTKLDQTNTADASLLTPNGNATLPKSASSHSSSTVSYSSYYPRPERPTTFERHYRLYSSLNPKKSSHKNDESSRIPYDQLSPTNSSETAAFDTRQANPVVPTKRYLTVTSV